MAALDGKLYAVGGRVEEEDYEAAAVDRPANTVERFDPASNAWEEVAPMATPREAHVMAVLDGKLYAVGGYSDDNGYLSSVDRYDPALDAWEEVVPMATARAFAVALLM